MDHAAVVRKCLGQVWYFGQVRVCVQTRSGQRARVGAGQQRGGVTHVHAAGKACVVRALARDTAAAGAAFRRMERLDSLASQHTGIFATCPVSGRSGGQIVFFCDLPLFDPTYGSMHEK